MAYSRKDLSQEINGIIEAKLEAQEVIVVAWLVHSILSNHSEDGDLSDFSKFARQDVVQDQVDRCVQRFKNPNPEELEQLTLPGFKHVQKAYRIMRDDALMVVPIDHMTDDELDAKIAEHERMARGHRGHARELRRYKQLRAKAAVA